MKRTILTAIAWAALSISAVQAADLAPTPALPVALTQAPGAPGTAAPTPYPQITPRAVAKPAAGNGSQMPLPPIDLPQPPKDQPLPGVDAKEAKGKLPAD